MANDLETVILRGVGSIHKNYKNISDGWWLYHAPESFIQAHLASLIAKKGFCVFPECSPKRWKASRDETKKPKGRPFSAHDKKRFDLVIWQKNGRKPRALVEIKRAVNAVPVLADATKILRYAKEALFYNIRTAYLLVYSEAKRNTGRQPYHSGRKKLAASFKNWGKELKGLCRGKKARVRGVGTTAHQPQDQDDDEQWSWGVALYRIDYVGATKKKRRAKAHR